MRLSSRFAWVRVVALIVGILFIFGVLIIAASYVVGYVRGTRPIPGDASKFDAFASLPQIEQFAGDNVQLLSIALTYVKSDGTLDLTSSYGAKATYQFMHVLSAAPTNAAPLGVAGASPGSTPAELVTVKLTMPGSAGSLHDQYYNFGMARTSIPAPAVTEPIVTAPTCSLKQLWDAALKQDAPANAVAVISYDNYGYRFSIDAAKVHLTFNSNCELEPY